MGIIQRFRWNILTYKKKQKEKCSLILDIRVRQADGTICGAQPCEDHVHSLSWQWMSLQLMSNATEHRVTHTHTHKRPRTNTLYSECKAHLTEFKFLTHCVFACEVSAGPAARVTVWHYFRWLAHRWMHACQTVSSESLCRLRLCPVCFFSSSSHSGLHWQSRLCSPVWTSAYRSISPSICLPNPPARLLCGLSVHVSRPPPH